MHRLELKTVSVQGNDLPAIVVPESPFRMLLALLGCLVFVAVGIFILLDQLRGGSFDVRAWIAILLGIPFFGFGTVALLIRLINPRGVLIITPLGVEFPHATARVFVHWQDILQVIPYNLSGLGKWIGFKLSDAAKSDPAIRRFASANRALYDFDIGVSLGGDLKTLSALIEFYRKHPAQRDEIGKSACIERYKSLQASNRQ